MQIMIYKQPHEILLQTISVHKNEEDPLNTYLIFCPYCSYQLDQVQGIVDKISPGLTPTDSVVIIKKCGRCGMRYTFQESQSQNKQANITIARYKNPEHSFRCYISRAPLLSWDDQGNVYLAYRPVRVTLPFVVECPDPNCKAHYHIQDII
jgi:hypothetical protein